MSTWVWIRWSHCHHSQEAARGKWCSSVQFLNSGQQPVYCPYLECVFPSLLCIHYSIQLLRYKQYYILKEIWGFCFYQKKNYYRLDDVGLPSVFYECHWLIKNLHWARIGQGGNSKQREERVDEIKWIPCSHQWRKTSAGRYW